MTTALPLGKMEKPLTAPKPLGISMLAQESKEPPSGRMSTSSSKIKPALLPKPILKPKPNLNLKSPVIKSPHDSVHENNISNVNSSDSVNGESSAHSNKINSVKNKLSIFQSSNEQNDTSLESKTAKNSIEHHSIPEIPENNIVRKSPSKTSSVFNSGKVNDNYSVHIRETSVSTTMSNETLITTNVSLKSRKEMFETVKTTNIKTTKISHSSENHSQDVLNKESHLKNVKSKVSPATIHDKNVKMKNKNGNIPNSYKSPVPRVTLAAKSLFDKVSKSCESIDALSRYKETNNKEEKGDYMDRNVPMNQQIGFSKNKKTPNNSFLHSKSSDSLISSREKLELKIATNTETRNIETKKAFYEKLRGEIMLDKSDVGLLADDLWKRNSLGPHLTPGVSYERRWSLNSLKQESSSRNSLTDSNDLKPKSPIGDESFRNDLNTKLKRFSLSKLDDNVFRAKPVEVIDPNLHSDPEEPIYWEIEDIMPTKNVSDATNNNHLSNSSQTNRDEEKDFPSDLSDISDGFESSHSSWSDMEELSLPHRSSTLHHLVKATLQLTDGTVPHDTSITNNDSTRSNHKDSISNTERTLKQRQEDVESIGSNSTESSYSMTKRLSSWFGSFGKGSKRSSLFYCESSPDQSLIDHTYSNVASETPGKDATDSSTVPAVYASPQDVKPLSIEELAEKRKRKAFLVAQEVMSSEKVFVDVLLLLCKEMKEQCRSDIPESELEKVITPLPQLLCLNEDLLKDIKERINHWETLPKISDIFIKKGPFLKLYSSYIQNFEAQCNFFDECCQKYILFSKKVKEFEMSDHCKKLSVKHYMLKPIQRIPQYRLLLEDYLKYLEPESEDYQDTEKALEIVRNVADHANKSMKQGDHLCKLLQIQSKLGNYELIKPGRVFMKEGELYKLSRRGLQERYFILLSDCLLYTSYYGTVSGLRVNYELPLNGMRVSLPQTEDYNNEFSIITVTRSFTLRARSSAERQEWIDELQNAIKENQQHLLSFLNRHLETQHSNDRQLGKVAPLWITDSRVSMCQQCTSIFTVTFRRHHCRACGRVVCGPCSDFEAPLQYQKFKSSRVCEECFEYLLQEFENADSNMGERVHAVMNIQHEEIKQTVDIIRSYFKMGMARKYSKKFKKHVPQRLIEVTANDSGSQISGWLYKKSGRNWKRCWFVLKEQVLYRYKASEDIAALKSTPVLGYEVEELSEQENFKFVFQLIHKGQNPLVFAVDTEASYSRWLKAMEGATTLS